jgi:sigma-54 dependent transcriptional regulator, acetoin dehydrogenase operon transcriptional activator AcoR
VLHSADRGDLEIPVNVRVIAATNRELREMVERGEFREDLYFRLGFLRFRDTTST